MPGSVVSPTVPPGRPTSSYQELAAIGHCPVAGPSQRSPSLDRLEQVRSQCVFTVTFCEPHYHALWQAGRGTGQRRDWLSPWWYTESAVYQGRPVRSFSRPMAQNSSVLCGDGGKARASHMQGTHPLRALGAPSAQRAQLLAQPLFLCLLLLVEWSHNRRADAPAGRANSSG